MDMKKEDIEKIDALAKLMINPNDNFDELKNIYLKEKFFRKTID
jgi:hypothetical protein